MIAQNTPTVETTEYTVPTVYISAIFNGDYSALTDEESNTLDDFLESVRAECGIGHWTTDGEESEFSPFNDVDAYAGSVTRTAYVVFRIN